MATETQESTAAPEAKSAGLPQFDFQWWPGQIVWFLIMFLVVLLFSSPVRGLCGWRQRSTRTDKDQRRHRRLLRRR